MCVEMGYWDLEEVKAKAFAEGVLATLCDVHGTIDKVKAREKTVEDLEKQVDELRELAESRLSLISHGKLVSNFYASL